MVEVPVSLTYTAEDNIDVPSVYQVGRGEVNDLFFFFMHN